MNFHAKANKKRLHPTDWLILCLLVAVILSGAWWIGRARRRADEAILVAYTIALEAVSEEIAQANGGWMQLMPVGGAVTNERGSLALGEVAEVYSRPSLVPSVIDGEAVFLERQGIAELFIKVRALALLDEEDCYRVGDLPILCGTVGDFRIGAYLARTCRIVRVERVVDE